MKKKDVIEVLIEEVLFPNKGIGSIAGIKVMVKDTLPGQVVRARVQKKRNGIVEASLLEVQKRSEMETETGCSHFPACGGCAYQKISLAAEQEIKEKQVLKLFSDHGITGFQYEGITAPKENTAYRNKCEFSFGDEQKDGPLALGMRKRHSYYEVVTLKDCNIIDQDYLAILQAVLAFFQKRQTPFYHKLRHDGELRHLVVRKGANTGEILVNLVTTKKISFSLAEFCDMLLQCPLQGKLCGVLHTVNDSVADVVKSDGTTILFGQDYFVERLFHLSFRISAFSFFQTNTKGAEVLYNVVKAFAGNLQGKIVFDLYYGTGTISQIMAESAQKVIGIEIVEEAIEAAKENAKRNQISNCTFLTGDVLKKVEEIAEKPDLIIVDPPRDGIHPKAIEKILSFGAEEILYVSCKPTSLVRDLKVCIQFGYQPKRVKLVNQFGRSVHVETVVLLKRAIDGVIKC